MLRSKLNWLDGRNDLDEVRCWLLHALRPRLSGTIENSNLSQQADDPLRKWYDPVRRLSNSDCSLFEFLASENMTRWHAVAIQV